MNKKFMCMVATVNVIFVFGIILFAYSFKYESGFISLGCFLGFIALVFSVIRMFGFRILKETQRGLRNKEAINSMEINRIGKTPIGIFSFSVSFLTFLFTVKPMDLGQWKIIGLGFLSSVVIALMCVLAVICARAILSSFKQKVLHSE